MTLLDTDIVSRAIIEPLHIDLHGVLTLNVFFANGNNCESVNCNRLLNDNSDDIHNVGITIQDTQNQRRSDKGQPTDKVYKGYIEALKKEIRNIESENISFDVTHEPSPNNVAHCHLHLISETKPKKSEKILAIDNLQEVFSPLNAYKIPSA